MKTKSKNTTTPTVEVIGNNKVLSALDTTQLLEAHKALHDKRKKYITVDGVKQEIKLFNNTNRQVQFKHVVLVEQETSKDNILSHLASKGEKISWGINKGAWFAMYNNTIYAHRAELLEHLESTQNAGKQ